MKKTWRRRALAKHLIALVAMSSIPHALVFLTLIMMGSSNQRFSVAKATLQPPMSVRPSVSLSVTKTTNSFKSIISPSNYLHHLSHHHLHLHKRTKVTGFFTCNIFCLNIHRSFTSHQLNEERFSASNPNKEDSL